MIGAGLFLIAFVLVLIGVSAFSRGSNIQEDPVPHYITHHGENFWLRTFQNIYDKQ